MEGSAKTHNNSEVVICHRHYKNHVMSQLLHSNSSVCFRLGLLVVAKSPFQKLRYIALVTSSFAKAPKLR